jgi:hypothetical protein
MLRGETGTPARADDATIAPTTKRPATDAVSLASCLWRYAFISLILL